MRSCAIHVHKHSVEAMLFQQCREITTVILSITPWLPAYMAQSLIRCNSSNSIDCPPCPTSLTTLNGPNSLASSFFAARHVLMFLPFNMTRSPREYGGASFH